MRLCSCHYPCRTPSASWYLPPFGDTSPTPLPFSGTIEGFLIKKCPGDQAVHCAPLGVSGHLSRRGHHPISQMRGLPWGMLLVPSLSTVGGRAGILSQGCRQLLPSYVVLLPGAMRETEATVAASIWAWQEVLGGVVGASRHAQTLSGPPSASLLSCLSGLCFLGFPGRCEKASDGKL